MPFASSRSSFRAGGHRYLSGLRARCYRVAREVEVEGVFRVGDFVNGDHAGVARVGFLLPFEDVDDAVDILRAEAVLGAVFADVLGGIDHEDAFAGGSVFLINDEDAGGDADDGFEIAGADELPADDGFGVAREEDAVGKNAGGFAGAFGGADDVEGVGVITCLRGGAAQEKRWKGSFSGVRPLDQVLSEKGGLATTSS
jgi:hypothetical protein